MSTYLSRLRSHPTDTASLYPRELTELDGTIYFTKSDGTVVTVNPKNVDSAAKFTSNKTITLTGAVSGSVTTDFSTNPSITTTIDASKITTGTLPLSVIPQGALERLIPVANKTARLALKAADAQNGDVVKENDTGLMYFVSDETKLGTEAAFTVFTSGSASAVPWSGVTGKPTFATVATSGKYTDLSDKPTIYQPSNDAPAAVGTASAGGSTAFARADHVHAHNTVEILADQATTSKPSPGSTIDVVEGIVRDSNGHVKKIATNTITLPTHVSLTVEDDGVYTLSPKPGETFDVVTGLGVDSNGHLLKKNQGTITLPVHVAITKSTDGTSTASPAAGGTFTAIDSITRDDYGHVTKINTKTVTIPTYSNHVLIAKSDDSTTTGTGIAPGSNIVAVDGVTRDGYGHVTKINTKTFTLASDMPYYGIGYATCSTTADSAAKVVTLANFKRKTGSIITVKFTNGNTNSQPTLNVNSTGAAIIVTSGSLRPTVGTIKANDVVTFVFDGTYWVVTSIDEQISRYTVSISTTGWSEWTSSAGSYYYQKFTVTGMTSLDYPIVDLVVPAANLATSKNAIDSYACIYKITTTTNAITVYTTKVPTTSFTIQLINPKIMHS